MKTDVRSCTCSHKFQDEKYGKGKRLHNFAKKSEKFRCTVCKKEK